MNRFYAGLLRLYPKKHREKFGDQMMRTFDDSYRDTADPRGHVPIGFWVGVLWDESESIVRERSSSLVVAGLVVWGVLLVFMPPLLAPPAWPLMLVPAGASCAFMLAAPKIGGAGAKAATALVTALVIAIAILVGQAVGGTADLATPVLTIACILFSVKAVGGWLSTAPSASMWTATELSGGLVIGAVGVSALATGAGSHTDYDSTVYAVLYGLIPLACAVAGYVIGRAQPDLVAAMSRSAASFLLGLMMWVGARPLIALALSASDMPGWRRALAGVLMIYAIFACLGGALGLVLRDEALRQRSAPRS